MTIEKYLIRKTSLEKLFNALTSKGKKVYAPVKKGKQVNYELIKSLTEKTDDYIQTTLSAKSVAFPKTEVLVKFKKEKDSIEVNDFDLSIIPEVVLWGVRPCDAAGFEPLSSIFNWDTKDSIYNKRLDNTTIIGISCNKADEFCFCTSVNGNPGNTAGSDILLSQLKSGDFLAEVITDKGKAIKSLVPDIFETAPSENKEDNLAQVKSVFDYNEIKKKVDAYFNSEIWAEQSMRCIGCGACAYVCPTCACFDIQDEKHGKKGLRYRSWDSCGFSLFTIHTSGHNPRETQAQRWRQRIMHKFSYMPDRQQTYGCVGCGRCSRACPVDMNIQEHLISIAEVKQ